MAHDFVGFPKIARFNRIVVVTEKIDGSNAQIHIDEAGVMSVGSRTKWITPEDDNYGFARWARDHEEMLKALGPGSHFGEWYGQGIQRRYGLTEKRWALFNTGRWVETPPPPCCHVVPVLWQGKLVDLDTDAILEDLAKNGSKAVPGFMNPEGIVIYHTALRQGFKRTIKGDDGGKSVGEG